MSSSGSTPQNSANYLSTNNHNYNHGNFYNNNDADIASQYPAKSFIASGGPSVNNNITHPGSLDIHHNHYQPAQLENAHSFDTYNSNFTEDNNHEYNSAHPGMPTASCNNKASQNVNDANSNFKNSDHNSQYQFENHYANEDGDEANSFVKSGLQNQAQSSLAQETLSQNNSNDNNMPYQDSFSSVNNSHFNNSEPQQYFPSNSGNSETNSSGELLDKQTVPLLTQEDTSKPDTENTYDEKDEFAEEVPDSPKKKTKSKKSNRKIKKEVKEEEDSELLEFDVIEEKKNSKSKKKKTKSNKGEEGESSSKKKKKPKKKPNEDEEPNNDEDTFQISMEQESGKEQVPKTVFKITKRSKKKEEDNDSDKEMTFSKCVSRKRFSETRRSSRQKKQAKYTSDKDVSDDLASNESSDDVSGVSERETLVTEDPFVVEKILACRPKNNINPEANGENGDNKEEEEPKDVEQEEDGELEYYVKFKNMSYLHCDWKTEEELKLGDSKFLPKLKRYKLKREAANEVFSFPEDELFNPDFVEIDRVLERIQVNEEETEEEDDKEKNTVYQYLVKWRALAYEDCTWEREDVVDQEKIQFFLRINKVPPKEKRKIKKKPQSDEWKKIDESPVFNSGNTLREYQLEGVNWLTFCWYNGQNCILADEMGLGKTIQSLSLIQQMYNYGIPGPYLIIAPLSTIGNWQREFETWTDLNVIVYHGSSQSRSIIQQYEMYYRNTKGEIIKGIYKFNVFITTFEMLMCDSAEFKAISWRCCIIDEAHRLKNRNCKLLEGLRLINMEQQVLLTGTPLQNNVEELYSLLNFLEPSRFYSLDTFMMEFGDLKSEGQIEKLQALLKPMMLRRLKEDVEKSLAPKEETIVEVELTNIQKKYYRAILERNFSFLSKGATYTNVPNLMNTVMELRKCCIHPFLINGAEDQILYDYKAQHGEISDGPLNAMIQASGKLVLIDKLLPRLRAGGHRVLVFSQMVRCLDILEDYLLQRRYPYERIDGRVRGNLRQAAIDRFSKPDSDRFVFLLCTRAGGLGINLTAADTVIIFDSDWNPQNDLQAQARCHRIGQSKAVKIYRLICRNTYEREMFDRASLKLGLDKAVLQSLNSQKDAIGQSQQLSKKEIEDLLRKGAYGALMDDDEDADKFCEEDIEQILQRRTQVITMEDGQKGSTFAKATFSLSNNRSDIEIDDPNFWDKWAKKVNIDVDELNSRNDLIIEEPRRRTRTKHFGTDDTEVSLSGIETDDENDTNNRSRRSRNRNADSGESEFGIGNLWARNDCVKVEKGILTFGWGCWKQCLEYACFNRIVEPPEFEDIARIIIIYSLRHYRGDEKIKGFIWDLITPSSEGEVKIEKNHSGLAAPVPRGRKGRNPKMAPESPQLCVEPDWVQEQKYNPDVYLHDEAYKRHLHRHANTVLLRIRLLYYLKYEVIGDMGNAIADGVNASTLPFILPPPDREPPAPWWNEDADKSLLVGVFKHGYERYNLMRNDPALCFLSRCGPPSETAIQAEISLNIEQPSDEMKEDLKEGDSEIPEIKKEGNSEVKPESDGSNLFSQFPLSSDLNLRLRRIITGYQRCYKKGVQLAQRVAAHNDQEHYNQESNILLETELRRIEFQQRQQNYWSRREASEFYKAISSFGIDYNKETDSYDWSRFRTFCRLDRKSDDTLTKYFKSFFAMCKLVCGKSLTSEEMAGTSDITMEPITEERASKCIQRIELLNKIRQTILNSSDFDELLNTKTQPYSELPEWWISGKHDKELLMAVSKHGLYRLDYYLLNDPSLSFKETLNSLEQAEGEGSSAIKDLPEAKVSLEVKGRDPTVAQLLAMSQRKIAKWPKDKILKTRIEQLCYLVEKKEWPKFTAQNILPTNPLPMPTSNHFMDSTLDARPLKRKRRSKSVFNLEKAKLHDLLSHNMSTPELKQIHQLFSSPLSLESTSKPPPAHTQSHSTPPPPPASSWKTPSSPPQAPIDLSSTSSPVSPSKGKSRQGRRIDALALSLQAKKQQDSSLPLNLNTSESKPSPLTKDRVKSLPDLPKPYLHNNVQEWLKANPEILAANPKLVEEAAAAAMKHEHPSTGKRGRKAKLNPANFTGNEKVVVINRLTQNKEFGSKSPTLKTLSEWLDRNLLFDVDSRYGKLAKEMGYLPERHYKRIYNNFSPDQPSKRTKRETISSKLEKQNNIMPSLDMLDPTKNPSLLFPYGMNLTNPLGFPGFPYSGMPQMNMDKPAKEGKHKKSSESPSSKTAKEENSSVSAMAAAAAAANLPLSSYFPYFYTMPNLLYNPLALSNFAAYNPFLQSFNPATSRQTPTSLSDQPVTFTQANSTAGSSKSTASPAPLPKSGQTLKPTNIESDEESLKSLLEQHDDEEEEEDMDTSEEKKKE